MEKELSIEDKIKIARAPLPSISFVKSTYCNSGASTYKHPDRKLEH